MLLFCWQLPTRKTVKVSTNVNFLFSITRRVRLFGRNMWLEIYFLKTLFSLFLTGNSARIGFWNLIARWLPFLFSDKRRPEISWSGVSFVRNQKLYMQNNREIKTILHRPEAHSVPNQTCKMDLFVKSSVLFVKMNFKYAYWCTHVQNNYLRYVHIYQKWLDLTS